MTIVSLGYGIMLSIPTFLDIIIPLNNRTREKTYPIEVNYVFFDKNDYSVFASLHIIIIGVIMVQFMMSVDLILFSCVQHACGMLNVLR